MGSQERHRCQAGSRGGGVSRNLVTDGAVDFVRDGSARYVGAVPGRDLRCTEERGSGCLPRARVVCALIPWTDNINVYWNIIVQ